jgi:hypothetical protein
LSRQDYHVRVRRIAIHFNHEFRRAGGKGNRRAEVHTIASNLRQAMPLTANDQSQFDLRGISAASLL